jgi:hypothetical protein
MNTKSAPLAHHTSNTKLPGSESGTDRLFRQSRVLDNGDTEMISGRRAHKREAHPIPGSSETARILACGSLENLPHSLAGWLVGWCGGFA